MHKLSQLFLFTCLRIGPFARTRSKMLPLAARTSRHVWARATGRQDLERYGATEFGRVLRGENPRAVTPEGRRDYRLGARIPRMAVSPGGRGASRTFVLARVVETSLARS